MPNFMDYNKGTPHVLFQFSQRQYQRLKDNCIHLTQGYKEDDKIYYKSICYGDNVKKARRCRKVYGSEVKWSNILINQMKLNTLFITTSYEEICSRSDAANIVVLDGTTRCAWNDGEDDAYSPSGRVVLGTFNISDIDECTEVSWGLQQKKILKKIKNNTINKTNNHNQSEGLYFSFGNKAFYGRVGNSSVSQYAIKGSDNEENVNLANYMVKLISNEITNGMNNVAKLVPNIDQLTSAVIDTANRMQNDVGDVNLKEDAIEADGVWMGTIAVNGHTKILHCEEDCTYTMVYVPKQYVKDKIGAYNFQISINPKHNIAITLYENTTMIFSGKTLTHRQTYFDNESYSDHDFVNFVSYGNKKLFDHLKNSFKRNMN